MTERIALKRLTASDLTFFEWHFRNRNAGNQKAINLNADVFVSDLYPAIGDAAKGADGRLPIDFWIFGPGLVEPINVQRKIIKGGAYKNWRLNGEFIFNPMGDETRFNVLEPGDFALLSFEGDLLPNTVTAVLVAAGIESDAKLHAHFGALIGSRSMLQLSEVEIEGAASTAGVSPNHPIHTLAVSQDLQDAASGDSGAVERLNRGPRSASLTSTQLKRAREAAEEVGQIGEELVAAYLTKREAEGHIRDFEWVSSKNAIAPLDFRIENLSGEFEKIDAKATSGPFGRGFHISMNELREMASAQGVYRIYRVYDASRDGAKLRISAPVKSFAEDMIKSLAGLPDGVVPDGFTVVPDTLEFDGPVEIQQLDDNEE